ncbi:MAG: DNA polymerase III subunit beta [Magnetococcales bacterium]|nr:DNA polymerase III subunit beta [Magnetococcales bacterium]MBF0150228.1 DNA polymerase III subunit beta [Magnetococcales bacterium]MBF0172558.1 DNA polymerase III subunit beta [Magnetococcales bacterium]MBF0348468.1 DNA polymerase III subunit beta [Magnetococcales bacterium]MBF0630011.1 DNA polymerase III subunit beta [Magnetococcales bacterium]
MEFHIQKDPFLKALSRIQTVVERRNTMTMLGTALLEAQDGRITLSATDLEVSLRTTCNAEIRQEGSMALNAKTLFEIVRELPPTNVTLRMESESRLILLAGRARFELAGFPTSEFPKIPQAEGERFHFERALLVEMFSKTHFAMSSDDSRFTLNGVLLQLSPATEDGQSPKVRMVATDTHRLAMVEKPMTPDVGELREVIIPKKAVYEMRKVLEEDQDALEIIMGAAHIQFIKPELTLVSKLVQGRFPDYRRVIPSQNSIRLNMDRQELDSVVKRISVLSHEKSRGIRMHVHGSLMKVSSNNPEQEAGEEEISVQFSSEDPFAIGFNARYLRDILTAMEGTEVCFVFKDDESPALVFDPNRNDALFVLMPMRV